MRESLAGLYLHVPFCAKVCPYCDFAVRTGDAARRGRYVDHLLAEIDLYSGYPLLFDTIYFGGGTPSSIEADDLARIVEAARGRLGFAESTRVFLEANPEDVSPESVAAWRDLGVAISAIGANLLGVRIDTSAVFLAFAGVFTACALLSLGLRADQA